MLLPLALLILPIVADGTNDTRRIINGQPVPKLWFPSTMVIYRNIGHGWVLAQCGGLAVSRRSVVTAKHCVKCKNHTNIYYVGFGARDIRAMTMTKVVNIRCAKDKRDLAVLLVEDIFPYRYIDGRIQDEKNISAAPLSSCQVAGWGIRVNRPLPKGPVVKKPKTTTTTTTPEPITHNPYKDCGGSCRTHYGHLDGIDRPTCRLLIKNATDSPKNLRKDKSQFCTIGRYKQDTCDGDSGSPLFCNGFPFGLVGWSVGRCARPDSPTVNEYLPYYKKWIFSVVNFWENMNTTTTTQATPTE